MHNVNAFMHFKEAYYMSTLGTRIKELRNSTNISQQELSIIADCHASNISRIENDKFIPSSDILYKIANYFHVSCDWLIYGEINTKNFTEDETKLIELYRKLAPLDKIEIKKFIEFKIKK